MTPGGSSPSTNSGPPPPLVFNLTDLQGDSVDKNVTMPSIGTPPPPLTWNLTDPQGDSVDKNVTAPPVNKTSNHQDPLVFTLNDTQGDSVDKNVTVPPEDKTSNHQDPLVFTLNDTQGDSLDEKVTVPPLDTLLNFNSSTKTKIKESSNGLEMSGPEMEEVPLGGDNHKSFMETEIDTLGDGDEDDVESEFYEDDLKNHGVNVDMFKSEENDEFLLPQRVKSASEESFDKQMGKKESRHILFVGKFIFLFFRISKVFDISHRSQWRQETQEESI